MKHPVQVFLLLCATLSLLTACGGGSSSATTSTTASATGVATPKALSVVTAN